MTDGQVLEGESGYAAFVTLPDRMHRVHTRMRRIPPPTIARTV